MSYSLAPPPRPAPSEAAAAQPTAPEVCWDSIVTGLNANVPTKASAAVAGSDDVHGWSAIVAGLNAELPDAAIVGR